MANIQPMMDHNYNIMTVCNKVTLPHVISCFSTLDLIFLEESIKCAGKIIPMCIFFGGVIKPSVFFYKLRLPASPRCGADM